MYNITILKPGDADCQDPLNKMSHRSPLIVLGHCDESELYIEPD